MNTAANGSAYAALPRGLKVLIIALVSLGAPLGGLIIWRTWWGPLSWVGVGLLSFCPMIAAELVNRFFPSVRMRPAMVRYRSRLLVTMVIYVVLLMAGLELYKRGLTAGPLGWVVAVLPALPIIGVLGLYGRYFQEETDEFMRKVVMTSLVWSGALTLAECTIWGFLETFGKVPNIWMWAAPVAFFAQIGITGPLAGWKYR